MPNISTSALHSFLVFQDTRLKDVSHHWGQPVSSLQAFQNDATLSKGVIVALRRLYEPKAGRGSLWSQSAHCALENQILPIDSILLPRKAEAVTRIKDKLDDCCRDWFCARGAFLILSDLHVSSVPSAKPAVFSPQSDRSNSLAPTLQWSKTPLFHPERHFFSCEY